LFEKNKDENDTVKVEDVGGRRLVEADYGWVILSLDHSYSFHSIALVEPSKYQRITIQKTTK
jgi:hypothetical protein